MSDVDTRLFPKIGQHLEISQKIYIGIENSIIMVSWDHIPTPKMNPGVVIQFSSIFSILLILLLI